MDWILHNNRRFVLGLIWFLTVQNGLAHFDTGQKWDSESRYMENLDISLVQGVVLLSGPDYDLMKYIARGRRKCHIIHGMMSLICFSQT